MADYGQTDTNSLTMKMHGQVTGFVARHPLGVAIALAVLVVLTIILLVLVFVYRRRADKVEGMVSSGNNPAWWGGGNQQAALGGESPYPVFYALEDPAMLAQYRDPKTGEWKAHDDATLVVSCNGNISAQQAKLDYERYEGALKEAYLDNILQGRSGSASIPNLPPTYAQTMSGAHASDDDLLSSTHEATS